MSNKRKSNGQNENLILFEEVDGVCPICTVALVYDKDNKKRKKYEIAHIYPLNPTKKEVDLLKDEERLSDDVNHIDNLILLCGGCHKEFDNPRTIDDYRKLLKRKKNLIKDRNARKLWNEYKIENEISEVINLLSEDNTDIEEKIEYDAMAIDKKSNETLQAPTKRKIINQAKEYYPFIKDKLISIGKEYPDKPELISLQIKVFYLQLKQEETDQTLIFHRIVDWIYNKTQRKSKDASEIVVSFFVQNCEVFS